MGSAKWRENGYELHVSKMDLDTTLMQKWSWVENLLFWDNIGGGGEEKKMTVYV